MESEGQTESQHEVEKAVMFADVSGSTALYEKAGDQIASAAIEKCVRLLSDKTTDAGGVVVKTIGDEVMAVFPTADAAASAAVEMQSGINELPPVGGVKLGIRVGFHFGQMVEKDNDYFGDAVNTAARLSGQALKGQIILSKDTLNRLSPAWRPACRELYAVQVKGKEREVGLCQLIWEMDEEATMMSSAGPRAAAASKVTLSLGGQSWVLDDQKQSALLGRDKAADIVVAEANASRSHCKIEKRIDKFFITDHSSNGTFVQIGTTVEVELRREQLLLRDKGTISLGQRASTATQLIHFVVS